MINNFEIAKKWYKDSDPTIRAMVDTLISYYVDEAEMRAEEKYRKMYIPNNWDKFIESLELLFSLFGSIALIIIFIVIIFNQ